jgi:pyruvate/2-oxoglutarate dehydrogenase complex dihydrolipoamide acyltransferase (E2) component
MARTTARNANIDLSTIRGTGEVGRITLDDVKQRFIAKEGNKEDETAII